MPAEMLFWGIAACVVLGSLGLVFAPLLRGGGRAGRRASYDIQVFRDQLREIEADRDRGALTADEAAATRVEISRRLLAAADAEATEAAAASAPGGVSRGAAAGLMALLLIAAAGLYTWLGAPGLPDQPLRARLAQEAMEAMVAGQPRADTAPAPDPEDVALVEQLRAALARNPDDLEGQRLLVHNLRMFGHWREARAAQGEVVRILGRRAAGQDLLEWVELMVIATNGYVSPEAKAALSRTLELDPGNPLARYYSGLALLQGGRPDLTHRLWTGLLAEGPPDAPWIAAIRSQIGEVARLAGLPASEIAPAGPSPADVDAAGAMTFADRQAMAAGMVDQLGTRLAAEGGSVAEWAQLIRALGVLGRVDEAATAWTEARAANAEDPAAIAALAAAAREAGLTN